jgi:hypothetical protein
MQARERRQGHLQSLQVEMIAQQIAMTANVARPPLWDRWREMAEFLPIGWQERYHGKPTEPEDFDTQIARAMKRAVAYQAAQVKRGL